MGCNKRNCNCCNEKIISVRGLKGDQGRKGLSVTGPPGPPGSGGGGSTLVSTTTLGSVFISNGNANLNTDILLGSISIPLAGKYRIHIEIPDTFLSYTVANGTAGVLYIKKSLNGETSVIKNIRGIHAVIGILEGSVSFDLYENISTASNTYNIYANFNTPNTTETANINTGVAMLFNNAF